jgi:hypothetical protein
VLKLQPFHPISESIEIRGAFSQEIGDLVFQFEVSDPDQKIIGGLKSAHYREDDLQRADGLWQNTCFEAFWSTKGETSYYEFNVSPVKPEWNLYHFDSYRQPQPPHKSEDFQLIDLQITPERLLCRLRGLELANIEVSLCAVVKTAGGTYYFSTKHAGPKPDFHLRESIK